MNELRKCALCGHESADAIQVGGHEPGSQAPLALYHCLHIPSCQMRQKIMALVSEYADCRDDMHLPYVVDSIVQVVRGVERTRGNWFLMANESMEETK